MWKIVKIEDDVKDKVLGLLSRTPTTASLERLLSSYGCIHDEHRNSIGTEKAAKLLFCFKDFNKQKLEEL